MAHGACYDGHAAAFSGAACAKSDPLTAGTRGIPMDKPFYGRILIFVVGIMYFCSSGVILPAANIINPMMLQDASMGLNGTALGMGFSVFILFQGISAPLAGAMIAKMGARFTMTVGAIIMLLASCAMAFFAASPIAYIVCFGALVSMGVMMAGQISTQTVIGEWFVARRGVAMTAMMFIGASSAFFAPPVFEAFMMAFGGSWRSGWYLLIGLSAVMIPVALLFVKNRPADCGQLPDGVLDAAEMSQKRKSFKVYKNTDDIALSKALRTPAFWLISLAATGGFAAYSFASSQGVIHFTTMGLDRSSIVLGVAVMGAAGLAGKIVMGLVSDRFEPIRIISIAGFFLVAGLAVAASATSVPAMMLFYFLMGFGFGGINATFPTTMANYFGAGTMSKNLGVGIFITTIIASALPIMGGAVFDASGSCTMAFYVAAAIVALCAVAGLLVRIPRVRS